MKTNTIHSVLNLKSFYDFARLNKSQQTVILNQHGLFLDADLENDTLTRLYFLKGFFVEVIFSKKLNTVVDMIPYKQGYKLERFINVKTKPFTPTYKSVKALLN